MSEPSRSSSAIRGERTMSRGFVAQYAAEAALQTSGVASLEPSALITLKEAIGVDHEGRGVNVVFQQDHEEVVTITVFPIIYYGNILPEVAWTIQERVKDDVEKYTGLIVEAVHVHVKGVITREENRK